MNPPNQIQIKATDEKLKGEYANALQLLYTKEEFVFDFLNIFPPTGTLNARIIVSPSHFKRIIVLMQDNLKKYEDAYGQIVSSDASIPSIGF
jgi:hypothetical protein